MSSSLLRNSLVLAALLCSAVGAASKTPASNGERTERLAKLDEQQSMAAFYVEVPYALHSMQFERADGATLTVEKVAGGRDLVFVRGAPGVWALKRVAYSKGAYTLVRELDGPVSFEIVPGLLTYSGDFELASAQPMMTVRPGGITWDGMADDIRDMELDHDLASKAPFVFKGRAAAVAHAAGQPEAATTLFERQALLPARVGKDGQAFIDRIAAKYPIVLPAVGTLRKDAVKVLEKIGNTDARPFWSGSRWCMLFLDGSWGIDGNGIAISIQFADDKVTGMRLREFRAHGIWTMPTTAVLDDVEAWVDGR